MSDPPEPSNPTDRRVYVRRRSRMTVAQARALEKQACYSFLSDSVAGSFGREAPLLVEIGFGNGSALAEFATLNPAWNCIGVEVFRPGIGSLINRCERQGIENVKIVDREGLTFLESLASETVDQIWVLFPDPWPKTRHHKRRLVTSEFGEVAASKLKPSGKLLIATDWQEYADEIETALRQVESLDGGVVEGSTARNATKYEERGNRLGHAVSNFEYRKCLD